jgi:hypothetical protein
MYVRVPGGKGNAKDVEELGSCSRLGWDGLTPAGLLTVKPASARRGLPAGRDNRCQGVRARWRISRYYCRGIWRLGSRIYARFVALVVIKFARPRNFPSHGGSRGSVINMHRDDIPNSVARLERRQLLRGSFCGKGSFDGERR